MRWSQWLTGGNTSAAGGFGGGSWVMPWRTDYEGDAAGFDSMADVYRGNGVVFACVLTRMLVFSEARFKFRSYGKQDLYGNQDLSLLEEPWPSGTTGDLLGRMEVDASLAGNCYLTTADDAGRVGAAATGAGKRLIRLDPTRVRIILGSHSGDPQAIDAKVLGYEWSPHLGDPVLLTAAEVVHYSPVPDASAPWRGMSWITPILKEIEGDTAAMQHKRGFFKNGATPSQVVTFPEMVSAKSIEEFKGRFEATYGGAVNTYKTVFLGGGADIKPLTVDLKALDFKDIQGHGETRIAAAAGVPPVIVGLSEGLAAATYSNYAQARRRFADGTLRPLWRVAAASLEKLIPVPSGSELWYDDTDIAFLREDRLDVTTIQSTESQTIRTLIDGGFDPPTVIAAVNAQDWSLLQHSGKLSVQLQPPTETVDTPTETETEPEEPAEEPAQGEQEDES